MPRVQPRWAYTFESADRLRTRERAAGPDEGGEECSRGPYCAGRRIIVTGGERTVVPARTYGHFCAACQALIGSCLSEIPSAYVRLEAELGEPARRGTGVRSPFGPRLPLRADVDELTRRISETLLSWNERVRQVARLSVLDTQASRRLTAGLVSESAALLGVHLTVLLALAPGPMVRAVRVHSAEDEITIADLSGQDAGDEILYLHRQALLILGETVRQREILDGIPCRRCESMSLQRAEPPADPGREAPHSECRDCRDVMDRPTFDAWADLYSRWAKSSGVACRRCQAGRCPECQWAACACAAGGHAGALSVA